MVPDKTHPNESDLDTTAKLPMLEGTVVDHDVADDAVPLERLEAAAQHGADPQHAADPQHTADPHAATVAHTEAEAERHRVEAERHKAALAASEAEFDALVRKFAGRPTAAAAAPVGVPPSAPPPVDLSIDRRELNGVKLRAETYLELLRTREWRRGFDQNELLEWHAKVETANAGQGALQIERDRLQASAAALAEQLKAREAAYAAKVQELEGSERARQDVAGRLASSESELARLTAELSARDSALAAERVRTAQLPELQQAIENHDQEMAVLMAHLNEARRPTQSIQSDLALLRQELAQTGKALVELQEENRGLRATLERPQRVLETVVAAPAPGGEGEEAGPGFTAALVRLDGENHTPYTLGRRTRIGRGSGCELHIDSQSVSRHHALVIKGERDLLIEDLNSTNGVLINGRKVGRYFVKDGDTVTIGDVHFRCVIGSGPASDGLKGPAEGP
jgi:hypothetical protein